MRLNKKSKNKKIISNNEIIFIKSSFDYKIHIFCKVNLGFTNWNRTRDKGQRLIGETSQHAVVGEVHHPREIVARVYAKL